MIKATGIVGNYITYKGLPLVRNGKEIYYGDMADNYYLFILIMTTEKSEKFGIEIPNKLMIQICAKDGNVKQQKIVSSLSEAFEYGCPWLERANRE